MQQLYQYLNDSLCKLDYKRNEIIKKIERAILTYSSIKTEMLKLKDRSSQIRYCDVLLEKLSFLKERMDKIRDEILAIKISNSYLEVEENSVQDIGDCINNLQTTITILKTEWHQADKIIQDLTFTQCCLDENISIASLFQNTMGFFRRVNPLFDEVDIVEISIQSLEERYEKIINEQNQLRYAIELSREGVSKITTTISNLNLEEMDTDEIIPSSIIPQMIDLNINAPINAANISSSPTSQSDVIQR